MNDLVSVIVPIYNVDKYLSRCVNTLVQQDYPNIEILLIDDGSTDDCPIICDEWGKNCSKIRVFHKKNGGLSDARNFGVEKAKGEYIFFVDSDDFISTKTIGLMMDIVDKKNCEIVCGNYATTSDDTCDFSLIGESTIFENGSDACLAMMTDKPFMVTAWCKLIRRRLAALFPFPIARFQEDEATTYKYYYFSSKTCVLSNALYAYYKNTNGIIGKTSNRKKNSIDLLQSLDERMSFFKEKSEKKLYELTLRKYTRSYLEAISIEAIEFDRRHFSNVLKKDLKNKSEKLSFKLFLFLCLLFKRKALRFKYN